MQKCVSYHAREQREVGKGAALVCVCQETGRPQNPEGLSCCGVPEFQIKTKQVCCCCCSESGQFSELLSASVKRADNIIKVLMGMMRSGEEEEREASSPPAALFPALGW